MDAGIDAGSDGGSAPVILGTPTLSARCLETWNYQPTSTTPTQWSVSGPAGATIDPSTGALSWTPGVDQAGVESLCVSATNAWGTDTQRFDVAVNCTQRSLGVGCGCGAGSEGALVLAMLLGLRRRYRSVPMRR